MKNITSDIESLIAGFLTNSLSECEMKALNRWLDESEAHRKEFAKLRSAWILAGCETGKKNFYPDQGWNFIEQRLKPSRARRKGQFSVWRYAASLLFCVALGASAAMLALRSDETSADAQATSSTTIRVPLGSKSNITLPDGSTVWLNAGSEILYSSDFGLESRELQLTGEAFFDVQTDSLKPFSVHASGMTVKAYGTRFNVKAYPDAPAMVATLEEGMIDVVIHTTSSGKTASQTVKLRPKEQLVIQKASDFIIAETPAPEHVQSAVQETALPLSAIREVVITPNVQTELSTSWKDKKWIISDEPLAHFAENLERRYNVRIQFTSEELRQYRFSGVFENETVEQILTALSLAAPINYKFDKNNVVLSLNQKDKDKFIKILKFKE